MGAASKALTQHCSMKRIKGVCTLVVVVQETTAGSKKKMFAYRGNRKLVNNAVEVGGDKVKFRYENKMKSMDVPAYVRQRKKA